MIPVKTFLLGFTAVYVTIGLGLNIAFGPPGFSKEFQEKYRSEIDRYFATIKDPDYKLWLENPRIHEPDAELLDQIAFVDEFSENSEFKSEESRRGRYSSTTDWYNVIMVVILVVGLGRGPAGTLVAGMVAAERERIESIERKRAAAARRRSEAELKLELIGEEQKKTEKLLDARIAEDIKRIEAETEVALNHLREEREDRLRHEELLGQANLKATMVSAAIEELSERYRNLAGSEGDAQMIDRFLAELGARP